MIFALHGRRLTLDETVVGGDLRFKFRRQVSTQILLRVTTRCYANLMFGGSHPVKVQISDLYKYAFSVLFGLRGSSLCCFSRPYSHQMGLDIDSSLGGLKPHFRSSSKDVAHAANGANGTNGTKVSHHEANKTNLLSRFIESHHELESYK